MKKLLIIICLLPLQLWGQDVTPSDSSTFHEKMQWFKDAKLGIFIHWGIYAVNGISESWSFFNEYISHEDYLQQTKGFTAENYDPGYWAELITGSGARYTVITSKHHDGFALWDTDYGSLNAVDHSPAKRDLLKPFVQDIRKENLKVGLYYSLPDWSYDDYTHHTRTKMRYKIEEDKARWDRFQFYFRSQLQELKSSYDPDLWWFDGDWEHSAEEWRAQSIRKLLSKNKAGVIYNSRLQGHGDYATPEIGIPIQRPEAEYWELCMTMNDSWGFQHNDKHYKSPQQIIDIFVDCISKGGNLLLDIGPMADGTIPSEQIHILKELGNWTSKHSEAIYETRSGIPYDYYYGPTALSKDSTVLYIYVRDNPKDGKIALKGISNKINRIYVVGNGTLLSHEVFCKVYWNDYPGIKYVEIPDYVLDDYYTVLAVQLDGKIKLKKTSD